MQKRLVGRLTRQASNGRNQGGPPIHQRKTERERGGAREREGLFHNVLEGTQRKRENSRTAKSGLKYTKSGEVHLGTESRIHKGV